MKLKIWKPHLSIEEAFYFNITMQGPIVHNKYCNWRSLDVKLFFTHHILMTELKQQEHELKNKLLAFFN